MNLNIKVVPRSARSEIAGTMADGTLKVRIAAPPEKGKANVELRSFLARHFGVRQRDVVIVSGETSPVKRVRILNVPPASSSPGRNPPASGA